MPEAPVLTLPAGDGFRDRLAVTVTAVDRGPVTITATRGGRTVTIAQRLVLQAASGGWQAIVHVPDAKLAAGAWRLRVTQGRTSIIAPTPVRVGSGRVRDVALVPDRRVAYPRSPGSASRIRFTVRGLDETGTFLPLVGSGRLARGTRSRAIAIHSGSPAEATVSVKGMPNGPATLSATVAGPAGPAKTVTSAVRVAPTTILRVYAQASWPTVQPIVDDQLDTVTLTAAGVSSSAADVPVRGSIRISRDGVLARSWALSSSRGKRVTWDGRVNGAVVPGQYTVTVSEQGPDGTAKASTTSVTVSDSHLPFRIRILGDLRRGNQQGLAIGSVGGSSRLFVGVDLGRGSAEVDEYDLTGEPVASSPPLPLGHAAEIAVGPDGLLYVANGGPSAPTRIAVVDPSSWTLQRMIDVSALGPNGMIATDPAGGFVVFAGTPGAYTLTHLDADGALGSSVQVDDEGLPQGLEVVDGEIWLFSSLTQGNRITKLDSATGAVLGTIELAMPGEGEGEAIDPTTGLVYVGCHGPNRFGVLEPVTAR